MGCVLGWERSSAPQCHGDSASRAVLQGPLRFSVVLCVASPCRGSPHQQMPASCLSLCLTSSPLAPPLFLQPACLPFLLPSFLPPQGSAPSPALSPPPLHAHTHSAHKTFVGQPTAPDSNSLTVHLFLRHNVQEVPDPSWSQQCCQLTWPQLFLSLSITDTHLLLITWLQRPQIAMGLLLCAGHWPMELPLCAGHRVDAVGLR